MPERANATTELNHEHAEIEQLVQRIASLEPCPERTALVHDAVARFLSHARAEQRYLFPAFRKYLPQGIDEVVGEQRHVETVRTTVDDLERTDDQDESYDELVGRLVLEIQRHIEQQDSVLLPQLLDLCPPEEVNHLGRQMRYAFSDERGGDDD